jgi:DNA/RNA-binding domain of Phe-tRNA-synthetase-like protein
MDLSYEVTAELFAAFPGYRLGVVVFANLDNTRAAPELTALLRESEASARTAAVGNVSELPQVAEWRAAYRTFGAKPSEHRSSIEALLRRVVKPDSLPVINPLVDIGNIVSLQYLMPAGVHPLRHALTEVSLRFAREGDLFLASESLPPEPVTGGEVVLADQYEVLTRRWTWRQSVNTRTQASSRDVFFNIDGLAGAGAERVEDAMEAVVRLVQHHCGGDLVYRGVLTHESRCFTAKPA